MVNNKLKLGRYKYYKGKEYEAIGTARHTETFEDLVVYRALYSNYDLWPRPLKMFSREVEINKKNAKI